jgi:hypothetical protein
MCVSNECAPRNSKRVPHKRVCEGLAMSEILQTSLPLYRAVSSMIKHSPSRIYCRSVNTVAANIYLKAVVKAPAQFKFVLVIPLFLASIGNLSTKLFTPSRKLAVPNERSAGSALLLRVGTVSRQRDCPNALASLLLLCSDRKRISLTPNL